MIDVLRRRCVRMTVAVLLGSALLSALPVNDVAAQTPTRIRLTLDWRFEGQLAMFMMAKQKGYYEREGLDVTVDAGAGSGSAINRVVSGSHEVGLADMSALIEYVGNNPGPTRVQAVYLLYNRTPAIIQALKRSGITKPQDLAGKRIAAPVFDSVRKAFPIYARAVGIDPKSITWMNVDPAIRETLVSRGDADATTGFELNRLTLMARGVKEEDIVTFGYAEAGLKLYGNAVIAGSKLIEENPKALAAFIRASNRALLDTIATPDEAIKSNKIFDGLIDEKVELEKLKITLRSIDTPFARSNGLGAINKLDLENQVDDVAAAFQLKTKPNADLLFNSSFLPPQSERIVRRR